MPFIGEIRMIASNFAPDGWAFCDGQLLPISENDTLFTLIGTTYGGDGEETFALPNLQSRIPLHSGNGFTLAETGGAEEITLTVNQIPNHAHAVSVSSKFGSTNSPEGTVPARSTLNQFTDDSASKESPMGNAATINPTGGSQPHTNLQPYLAIRFIISLYGVFPSTNSGGDAEPYMGEMRWVAFGFAPKGWATCDGQLLPINVNQALFSILGTTYGGDGRVNFALPDLRGRAPIHVGSGHTLGERGGEQTHTLSNAEMPQHSHALSASRNPADLKIAKNNIFSVTSTSSYAFVPDNATLPAMTSVGGSQAHLNMQPFLCLNAIIATVGIFPSQN